MESEQIQIINPVNVTDDLFTESNDYTLRLSSDGLHIVEFLNYVTLSGSVCLMGIVTNVINLIIFAKQGLNNTINISLFAMAVSDLCSLITLEWLNINLNHLMENANVPYEPSEVQYLTGGWPHSCFSRITAWITVYMTGERCLCVIVPLKVKQIITPNLTKVVVCTIYAFMFLTLTPEYVTVYFGEKFSQKKNRTLVGLVNTRYRDILTGSTFVLYAVIGFVSFFMVILLTFILVVKLKQRSQWRNKSTFDRKQSEALSNRDKKTMNLVVLISTILIISLIPGMTCYTAVFIEPEFDLIGKYVNEFHACWSVVFLSEAINSSVNIFLYYKMSTKYRQTFNELFSKCVKQDDSASSIEKC